MKPTRTNSIDWDQCLRITETGACRVVTTGTVLPASQTDVVVPVPQDDQGRPRNLRGRHRLYIRNNGGEDLLDRIVYVGGRDVTTRDGYPLGPQEILILDVTHRVQLYLTKKATEGDTFIRTMEVA